MSATTGTQTTPHQLVEEGTNTLLYALWGAMLTMTVLACVLVIEGTLLWLLIAFGGLLVTVGIVGAFILKFIGETDH